MADVMLRGVRAGAARGGGVSARESDVVVATAVNGKVNAQKWRERQVEILEIVSRGCNGTEGAALVICGHLSTGARTSGNSQGGKHA
jgi:hypothetical protein